MASERDEQWSSPTAFILASIGSAVGLGNIWRFPRVCAANGGFAFLVAFVVALITAGIPILILELSLGRHTGRGAPGVFKALGRRFEWIGWCIVGVCFVIACYYTVVMGWCWNYIYFSVTQAWGSDPKKFFFESFLKVSDPKLLPGGWGSLRTSILVGAALSWVAIVACLWRGVKTVSKVAWYTVLVPWTLLLIFVVRGVTLPGAWRGLRYYLLPTGDWYRFLFMGSTWVHAYTQVFFSLSVGFGIMFVYGSYMKRETNILKSALIISIADALTAFVAGIAVFACLGHLASLPNGPPVESWVGSSLGIAFVAYPKLISVIPLGSVLGPLFFGMLLLLAVDSAFSLVEAIAKPIREKFGCSHRSALFGVCGAGFVVSLPFMFRSGLYWFDVADHFMNHFGLMVACLVECLLFAHIFGAKRLWQDQIPSSPIAIRRGWTYMVRFVGPVVLLLLLGHEIVARIRGSYEGYGRGAEFWGGWLVLCVIVVASFVLARTRRRA